MTDPLSLARQKFIDKIGFVAQAEGLPRIAGRVMGLMVFDGEKYSYAQIAEELYVSRGSINTSVRTLIDLGVIERVSVPGDRQDYFQLGDDPYAALLAGQLGRAEKARQSINRSVNAVPKSNRNVRKRMKAFEDHYASVEQALRGID